MGDSKYKNFESAFRKSQKLRENLINALDLQTKIELRKEYLIAIGQAVNFYSFLFGKDEAFIINDISTIINKDKEVYNDIFTKDFTNFYISKERIFFFRDFLNKSKPATDLTLLFLEIYDNNGVNDWRKAYAMLDIFLLYDNKKAVPFMIDLIDQMNEDCEKYESGLFMNAISFCVDKISSDDVNYKRLLKILKETQNDDLKRLLPFYLNKIITKKN